MVKRPAAAPVATNWGPRGFRLALAGAAAGFIGLMAWNRFDSTESHRWVSGPLLFFAQMTGLFPNANRYATDFRAEAWLCEEERFEEIDETPFFPILAGNKESRFHRTLHFYSRHRPTLRALDAYLTGKLGTGEEGKVGGVRFRRLRNALPPPGSRIERHSRKPLTAYEEQDARILYYTPMRMREERCGEEESPG